MQIKGKTVLVTGGTKRIGAAIVKALTERGARVDIFRGDLREIKEIQKSNPVQILINNAAIFERAPFLEVTEEMWNRHCDINLKAPFFLTQAVAKSMLERKEGKIINIADVAAFKPYLGFSHYSATKGGLITLTKALAQELAPYIQVNAIALGPTLPPESYSKETQEKIAQKTLLKRWGDPKEVANAVCFLIEGTDFATGSVLTIDGGRLLV